MLRLELRRMEVLHPGDPGRKRRWDVDHCVSSVLDFFIGIQSSHLIKPSYAILFFFFVLVRTKMSIGWLSRQKLMPHHATRVTDSLIIIIIIIIMLVRGLCCAPIVDHFQVIRNHARCIINKINL